MTDQRFTTEEAERIEGELETDHLIYWDPEFRCSKYTRDSLAVARGALRSLAAERDRLGNEVEHHVEELDLRMKAIREQEKRMAALAAERDGLRIAVINAAFALQRIREIADLSPTWWNDPSAGVGRIAADAERELRVAREKAQP